MTMRVTMPPSRTRSRNDKLRSLIVSDCTTLIRVGLFIQ
jgi:hypothetical protein